MTYTQHAPLDAAIICGIAAAEGLDLATVPTGGGAGMAPLVLGRELDFAHPGGTHAHYTPGTRPRARGWSPPSCRSSAAPSAPMCPS